MTEEKAQIKNHGNIGFRYAKGKDAGLVLEFLKRLSEYEKAEEHLVSTPELLQEELERDNGAKALFVLADGKEVGMALFFRNFSGYLGGRGFSSMPFWCWKNTGEKATAEHCLRN